MLRRIPPAIRIAASRKQRTMRTNFTQNGLFMANLLEKEYFNIAVNSTERKLVNFAISGVLVEAAS